MSVQIIQKRASHGEVKARKAEDEQGSPEPKQKKQGDRSIATVEAFSQPMTLDVLPNVNYRKPGKNVEETRKTEAAGRPSRKKDSLNGIEDNPKAA